MRSSRTGPGRIISASARPLVAPLNAPSKSGSGPPTSRNWSVMPKASAATRVSCKGPSICWAASAASTNTAAREISGNASFSSSSLFPLSCGEIWVNPVMFPPGFARLATNPAVTGSPTSVITRGIVLVACRAARVPGLPPVTMTSTLSRTSSAARSGSRSSFPSANRYSMTMFFPSTYPRSRRACRNPSRRDNPAEGDPVDK